MPDQFLGLVDAEGDKLQISSAGSIAVTTTSGVVATYAGADPSWTGVYLHGVTDVPGTVAAQTYLTLFNPVGSTKLVIVVGVTITSYSTNTVTGAVSTHVHRISAHSGGTQQSAATINRFYSAFPNPAAEVRFGNPTITNSNPTNPLIAFAPSYGTGAQSPNTASPTPGASFVLLPGEGVAFEESAGDVDLRWNVQIIWAEKNI
jgi:hypothetical protein